MKRSIAAFLCLILYLGLCACGGNVAAVKIGNMESEIYSEEEILSAMRVVMREFSRT